MTNTNRPIRRALVSVFHKEGIEVLAEAFVKAGTEVVSTGSTAKKLAELGVKVTEVSDVTGFPECLDGRVKTLHPYIHAGILADMTNPEHAKQLEEFGIKPFDWWSSTCTRSPTPCVPAPTRPIPSRRSTSAAPPWCAARPRTTPPWPSSPTRPICTGRLPRGRRHRLLLGRAQVACRQAFAHTAAYDATINEWTAKHWPKPASLDAVEVDKDDQALKSIPPSSRPSSPAPGIVRTPCATARTPTSRPPSTSTRSTRPVSPTPSSSAASR